MKTGKIAALLVSLLVLVLPLLVIRTTPAQTNPVYYSVEPVAIPPLTNLNASINGLETPPTPSPVGQNFTVSIHLRGATAANVPAGMSGVEVHFYFGNIVTYAVPTEFTDLLGQTGGVLQGPKSKLLYAVSPGFYDALNNPVSAPFTTAVYYEVAAASTGGGWNGADGLVANLTFQIIKQPQGSNGEQTVSFELANDFTDLSDANAAPVSHDNIPGALTIDATPGTGQRYSLTVNVVGNGTVSQNPASTTYVSGTNVTLTATPNVNWTFQGWSGDLTGIQNPANLTMNANKTVTATFVQGGQYYTLTISIVGNGNITKSPLNTTYLDGTIVTLTAVPGFNWTFQSWSGDLTGAQNPANITMNGNKVVAATFILEAFGGNIDLFTQKTPFGGRGPNQPSDAFQPQELVVLYALVTFNGDPLPNKVVSFEVKGPANTLQNITVIGSALTNGSGIAEFSFRMPTPPIDGEQIVFGKWHALATVDVDQVTLTDSLTFEVGWIIRIKSIVTLNGQLSPQTNFPRQTAIVFNLTLENIALTPKTATITIDAQDIEGYPIIHIELLNLSIQPGESHTQASSQIPINARIGEANVSAKPYTAPPEMGGTAYSPSVYTTFNIISTGKEPVTFDQTGLDASALGTVVTVNGTSVGFGQLPYTIWVDSGSMITYSYSKVPSSNPGQQFALIGVTGLPNPITVTGPVSVTGNYRTQYQVTFSQTGVGSDFTGTIVTIDETGYSYGMLPVSFWWDNGSSLTFSFSSPLTAGASEVRYWVSTSGLAKTQSGTLIVTGSGNVTGNYAVQSTYQITFDQSGIGADYTGVVVVIDNSSYGVNTLPASFNWSLGSVHNFAFQSPLTITASGVQYVWTNTSGLSSTQNGSITVSREGSVTGNYKSSFVLPYWVIPILFLVGLAVLAGVVALILLLSYYMRRGKKKTRRASRYAIIVHPHV
jgi:hypothetical protein